MFTAILGNLTSLLPRSLIFGCYVPVLIFGFINGILLYWTSAWIREALNGSFAATTVLSTAILFTLSIVAAYTLSSLQNALRSILEGQHLPGWITSPLRERQQRRLTQLDYDLGRAGTDSAAIGRNIAVWEDRLYAAGTMNVDPERLASGYDKTAKDARAAVRELKQLRRAWRPIEFEKLEAAVTLLEAALKTYAVKDNAALKADFDALKDAINYARPAATTRELESFAQRQTEYGTHLPAPTRLGNIAASLQSYTRSRYGFDIDTFWGLLQPVLQKNDEKAYAALVDAKTQVDFLIACSWGSALTGIGWGLLFAIFSDAPIAAAISPVAGVVAARLFYEVSTRAYVSYTEFARACVDLNRFALLRALHIPLPMGIRDERILWSSLQQISSFGSEFVELSYEHSP